MAETTSWGNYLTKGVVKQKQLIITGFGSFGEISSNPTQEIVLELSSQFPNTKILEVSKEAVDEFYSQICDLDSQIIVHLGVHGGATAFHIETMAWNNMTFSIPDTRGFRPNSEKILETFELDSCFESHLPLSNICDRLRSEGFQTTLSTDPGRYICNYTYYKALSTLECSGKKRNSVFLHVPPFDVIPKDDQLAFVRRFLSLLSQS